ncbi:hypothetical protein K2173_024737 [Erythroxylum novogranatense]|uniref:Uncharacterized protein n=1 Tax=Erythroxylum novogranatense TaxID=1862640 RepID=A0AAV8SV71_9ROSI|nr:hypothetical protein K2173_024737 [Erythroxylum novogranatense]
MASILSSQGLVFATAMVVSSTALYLAFSKQKSLTHLSKNDDSESSANNLRSCLCTEGKKKKKKKRVRFADNVKDTKGNGKEYRKKMEKYLIVGKEKENPIPGFERTCRDQIKKLPGNRIALYSGILRDRVHKMECSF